MKKKFVLAALPLFLGAHPAIAAVTYYSTQAAFTAATSNPTATDTFENTPPNSATDYYSGYTGAGFTINSPQHYLYNVDPGYSPPLYDWGSGDVMLFSDNGSVTFNFTSAVTAFSIDLMSVYNYGATITASGDGFSTAVSTANHPNRTFFGLSSDVGINSFTLQAAGAYGEFDNFTIASATPAAVPEPTSWAMFIGGFGMIGGAVRSRLRKAAVSFA